MELTTQQSLYSKDIFRPIEGVIKAGDDRHLMDELDEYVLTDELLGVGKPSRMLPGLFEELAKPAYNSSVWISGHFGSGKSHLLKMLSLVLENREINAVRSAEVFAQKTGENDFEFKNSVLTVSKKFPTQSILFNIAAKADGITGLASSTLDPVLSIFLKVFNEVLGYDPLNREIAELERHLDAIGKYEYLKSEYQRGLEKRGKLRVNQYS